MLLLSAALTGPQTRCLQYGRLTRKPQTKRCTQVDLFFCNTFPSTHLSVTLLIVRRKTSQFQFCKDQAPHNKLIKLSPRVPHCPANLTDSPSEKKNPIIQMLQSLKPATTESCTRVVFALNAPVVKDLIISFMQIWEKGIRQRGTS